MNNPPLVISVVSRMQGRAKIGRKLALTCMLLPAVGWGQPQTQAPAPVEQIVVTGTRLANPNLISTSPIQVVTSREIAISGKNDAFDILQMLPQNLNNDLGQDLGNRTSGLTTPGGLSGSVMPARSSAISPLTASSDTGTNGIQLRATSDWMM